MKVLVVGGAGYIGSHLVRVMAENEKFEVVVMDNFSLGHREAVREAVIEEADLNEKETIEKIFEKHEIGAVMHFSAKSLVGESVENPAIYYRNNVIGTFNLLEVMRKFGVKNFIFSSTAAVYGVPEKMPIRENFPLFPINPYGKTKVAIEGMLADYEKAYGLAYVIFRYFNAAGAVFNGAIGEDHNPESHLIPIVMQILLGKREKLTIFGEDYDTADGTCVRDYIHVLDLARAHILGLKKLVAGNESGIFNLGTGQGYSVKEVVETVERVTGKRVPRAIGERRPGDPPTLVAASDNAKKVLGWVPVNSDLDTIVKTAWEWHRKHPNGF